MRRFAGRSRSGELPLCNLRLATWNLAFLGRTLEGQVQVVKMVGYQPVPISIPELDYRINNFVTVEDAQAFSYMLGGHQCTKSRSPNCRRRGFMTGCRNAGPRSRPGPGDTLRSLRLTIAIRFT